MLWSFISFKNNLLWFSEGSNPNAHPLLFGNSPFSAWLDDCPCLLPSSFPPSVSSHFCLKPADVKLDEAQAGIKIARRNINNLRYAGNTNRMADSKELKSLNESERGEWKVGLKLNIHKTEIMATGPITSWQIDGETMETVTDFIWRAGVGLQDHCR